jgi:hypothetical protein
MGLGVRELDRPAPGTDDLLTWDELLAAGRSGASRGRWGIDGAQDIVLHHLLWSRSDARPGEELILVALDAGDGGWLTAVPAEARSNRYSVVTSSPPELWRALCLLLDDLAR